MSDPAGFVLRIVLIGVAATAFLDLANFVLSRVLRMRAPDYAMVGRWIGHFPRGQFVHASIGKAERVAGEAAIGWAVHYAVGIAFALVLVLIAGPEWMQRPDFAPAFAVGIASVAAPFLIMQPSMGAGFAAAKTPNPNAARGRSLLSHALFGVGLYVGGLLAAAAL